ncbi:MAG: restriction endonuclease [Brevundimonas sp.]|uniref:winged helix-turn-helix domain-containing protein n=1 Tax=Brevundimonas sp. TaxID=1871086 RepID=UPI002590A7A6|nr:winged helix-turn-helix domain-containing protein [Brevundimonas sp.]MCV0416576.1 restriction endonuclease [Brevundimonas sp.]
MTQSPTLPKYDDLFRPTLEALSSLGGSGSIEELDEALISSLGITQEQLDVTYPKSGAPVLPDRMSWARSFLKIGGFVKNPKRGVWVLTEEGRAALSKSNADLKKIISAADRAAIAARKAAQAAAEGSSSENGNGDSLSWPDLLLQRVQAVEPAAFERLCQRLLRESGFTRVEVTGKTADGGIDGVGVLRVNLADQQADLLLELEPDAILVASATMRTPSRLGQIIGRLEQADWSGRAIRDKPDEPQRGLVTALRSGEVVEAGLVKRQIILGGYSTEMETALADLVADFNSASAKAEQLDAGFRPKAIYVCRTNITLDDGTTDIPSRPFTERRARPILIWRYLVEVAKVDPAAIAVYCDLKVDRKGFPLPPEFRLFSGGEDDFAAFTAGGFRHVIFNQSLQEGWDDPECGFAYIDKSMGSAVQVEQVIGRVLRQPGAQHYADPDLNTAHFYIRVDDRQDFQRTLNAVREKLGAEMPEVRLEGFSDARDRKRSRLEPRERRTVPEIHIDADAAVEPMDALLETLPDYTGDTINVHGAGEQIRAVQAIGDGSDAKIETRARDHSNRVVARWLIRRAMQRLYPEAVKTVDWADRRFDARVEVTSPAAQHLRDQAERLVDVFLENAELAFETTNPYTVDAVLTRPDQTVRFNNALHEGYSDLNGVELEFARAIDALELPWSRNPTNGGYSIPLLEKGGSRRFFPDFLVWNGGVAYALDPKGKHLILEDAGRKLLAIRDERGNEFVQVRLITEGRWLADPIKQIGVDGYSVWRLTKAGKVRCSHHRTVDEAVQKAVDYHARVPA